MTRKIISEPNFTSTLTGAGPGSIPAKLEIVLTVLLAPMDPSKPNLNFNTHLADTPQQIRKGFVVDGSKEQTRFAAQSWMRRDFAQYKADFKRVVELSWNNQIILLPPEDPKDGLSDADYLALVGNSRMPAHVECSL